MPLVLRMKTQMSATDTPSRTQKKHDSRIMLLPVVQVEREYSVCAIANNQTANPPNGWQTVRIGTMNMVVAIAYSITTI